MPLFRLNVQKQKKIASQVQRVQRVQRRFAYYSSFYDPSRAIRIFPLYPLYFTRHHHFFTYNQYVAL
jgi:hypothetical protein